MKNLTMITAVAFAAALTNGCGDAPIGPADTGTRSFDDSFEWHGHIAAGDEIQIMGVAGSVNASFTEGPDVVVTAVKTGPAAARRTVAIDVRQEAGGITICAVYPDAWGTVPDHCGTGTPGPMSIDDYDVEVTFTVQVPAGVVFSGGTVAGNVVATDLRSDAFVKTVAGNLHVTTSQLATATTVSGSVDVSIGRADLDRDLTFSAVSGNVTVAIDPDANARIEARVTAGTVRSDFPLELVAPGILRGVIGHGGSALVLSSVAGNVTLRERR